MPEYIRRVEAGVSPEAGSETIDRQTALGEAMMLALRLTEEGMSTARFAAQFGETLEGVFGRQIARLANQGLVGAPARFVRLADRGGAAARKSGVCGVLARNVSRLWALLIARLIRYVGRKT